MPFKFGYKSEDDLIGQFENIISAHSIFTNRVQETVRRIIDTHNIPVVDIEFRTKDKPSFMAKATDPRKAYTDPLKQITDISGIRVICYYNTDVQIIKGLIEKEFTIDKANSEDKSNALGINTFGYRSVHQVIQYNEERAKLTENAAFKDLKAELQIRTICQHAWASIEHKLNYKGDDKIDPEIMRRLFRISGLLEVADDEFLFVKKKIDKIRQEYKIEFSKGDIDTDINTESLDVYLEKVSRSKKVFTVAKAHKFHINPIHPYSKNPTYSLNETLTIAKVDNISDLKAIIENPSHKVSQFLKLVYRNWNIGTKPPKIGVDKYSLLRIAVIASLSSKKSQQQIMNRVPFGPELHRAILETISDIHAD